MKVRSTSELFDLVCDEMSWRRKELSDLWLLSEAATTHEAAACRRAFVVLALGHWEGGVKRMAQAYLAYACSVAAILDDLKPCFVGLVLENRIEALQSSETLGAATELANSLDSLRAKPFALNRDAIRTGGNLSSRRLQSVCGALSLPYGSELAVREKFIDQALRQRHDVAHGKRLPISRGDVVAIRLGIDVLLDKFAEVVVESALAKDFLR